MEINPLCNTRSTLVLDMTRNMHPNCPATEYELKHVT